ncbi:MAG: hypothetical protein LPK26_04990 [Bacillaceae bacterium]|nr:hypothetical protein [Bacillaceae bacterium]
MLVIILSGLVLLLSINLLHTRSYRILSDKSLRVENIFNKSTVGSASTASFLANDPFGDNYDDLLNDLSDPYKTPGIDLNIDESYHGIDHGLGITNPDNNSN